MSHKSLLVAGLLILGVTSSVFAQDVPPEANKALWCATAFSTVEPQARASGATDIADTFHKYAISLNASSHDLLIKTGFSEDKIAALAEQYKKDVPPQMATPTAESFTQEDCTQLVDPAAAAKMGAPAPAN